MCGIVGAVSTRNIVPILVQGLQRLEYRGYDSCGVAVHADGPEARPQHGPRRRTVDPGREEHLEGTTGIAHTRWATHGAPAVHNAHPHFSHGPGERAPAASPGALRWSTTASSRTMMNCARRCKAKGYVFAARPIPR